MTDSTTDTSEPRTERDEQTDDHLDLTPGETLVEHPSRDGAIAGYATDIEPGAATHTVSVAVPDLHKAVTADLSDSYPSVFFWSDGRTLAITDHETPADGADVGSLSDKKPEVDVARVEAIHTPDDANVALVDRDAVATALDALSSDRIRVHVDTAWPVVLEGEEAAVAIAPSVKPSVAQERGI